MKKRLSDILKFVLFVGIGVFFIYWFLLKLEPEQKSAIWQSFRNADYLWVALAMLVSILSHLIRALRWNMLLQSSGCETKTNHTFGAVMTAYLANLAVPRLGEVLRCGVLRTADNIPMEKSFGTVVTERVVDVFAFLLTILLGLLLAFSELKDWLYNQLASKFDTLPTLGLLAAVGIVLLVLLAVLYRIFRERLLKHTLFRKLNNLLLGFIDGLKSVFRLRKPWLFIFYSLAIYFLYLLGGYVVFMALPQTASLPFIAALILYIFGSVGMMVTPGGIGLYPVLVWQALTIFAVSQEAGLACGWILWGSQQLVVLVLGMFYLVKFSLLRRKKNTSEEKSLT